MIATTVTVWGKKWFDQWLLVQLDNSTMAAVGSRGVSHNSESMYLLRHLSFNAAKFQLLFALVHIPGKQTLY